MEGVETIIGMRFTFVRNPKKIMQSLDKDEKLGVVFCLDENIPSKRPYFNNFSLNSLTYFKHHNQRSFRSRINIIA